jgi:hypothetical protein
MLKSNYDKSHEVDHVYYNGTLFNSSYDRSIPAQISDVLNGAIIEKGHDWDISVMRIGVSGHALPLASIINYIIDPLVDPFKTRFIVSMSYNGFTQSTNVIFIPTTNDESIIYNIYTYQHWLNCINESYKQCFVSLDVLTGGALSNAVNQAPFLAYDSSQNLFSLYCESGYDSTLPNPINIYMNRILFDYFDSFEIIYLDRYTSPLGLDVKFNIQSNTCNNLSPIPTGYPATLSTWIFNATQTLYQMKQQYPSAYAWNIIRSLVLTSSIGTQNESIPISFGVASSVSNSNLTILTDFESNLSENSNIGSRGYLQYVPLSEYRICNITNSSRIQVINLGIYYIDFAGKLTQLIINPRYSFSVKLLFRRKNRMIKN